MLKKFVAFGMVSIIGVSSVMPAYANEKFSCVGLNLSELTNENFYLTEQKEITEELEVLNSIVPVKNDLKSITTKQNDFVYCFEASNAKGDLIATEVTVEKKDTSDIELNIVEDNLENTILITADNKIYLDGNEVVADGVINTPSSDVGLRADRTIWTTEDCPYESARNYNDFVGNVSISNLRLETTIANITAFAFATLIGYYWFYGGLTTGAAILLKDEIIAYDNKTMYLSMKGKQYYHEDGHRIPSGIYVTKVVGTWYTNCDYQGDTVNFPVYNCKEYY